MGLRHGFGVRFMELVFYGLGLGLKFSIRVGVMVSAYGFTIKARDGVLGLQFGVRAGVWG